jgi:hypothetical protein
MTEHLAPVDLWGGDVRLAGVLHLEPTELGHNLHRLPAWTRPQVVDVNLKLVRAMPSGCRIELVTDATVLEIDAHLTMLDLAGSPFVGAGFDLVVDGELVDGVTTDAGTVLHADLSTGAVSFDLGQPTTIRFDGLPVGVKQVEVWLPHASMVDLHALRTNGEVSAPPVTKRRWVHHGSSISHCLEADRPTGVWPAVAARLAGVDLQSLGFGGQCQLDGFTARTIRDLPADLISCKVGINVVNGDTMRERTFVSALHNFLDTIREGHPEAPLVLVTPIHCAPHETSPGPSQFVGGRCTAPERPEHLGVGAVHLSRIRALEAEVVAARQAAGDDNLHLVSGLELFGPADAGDLPDDLHPNPAGYRRIGERFHEQVFAPGGPFAVT